MAKAKKLASGNWRCLVYDFTDSAGKRHYESFTSADRKEAEYMAAEFAMNKHRKTNEMDMTVSESLEAYCSLKSNVLSQTTLRAYYSMSENLFSPLVDAKLKSLSSSIIQKWINQISANHSPKTVHNAHGLLSAVLDTYAPDIKYNISLPQKKKPNLYVPSDSDIKALMDFYAENDKDMLIAVCMAAFGTLRRSEICALQSSDITGRMVSINKAMVKAMDNSWIIKTTKTVSSTRLVEMPQFIVDLCPKNGRIISIYPSVISSRFTHTLQKLNIPKFRFHDLRHYAASIMHALGIPDVYIMQRGGWSSDATLKQIYRGTIEDYQRKFTDVVINHFDDMQHEMQHKKNNP